MEGLLKRCKIREYAFMFLYQLEIQNLNTTFQMQNFLKDYPIPDKQIDFFNTRVEGVTREKTSLDRTLEPFLVKWTLDRLPKIDLTLLRLAVFEMEFLEEIPNNVAISEAVRLAKIYSTEDSFSYINAILGNIDRKTFKDNR